MHVYAHVIDVPGPATDYTHNNLFLPLQKLIGAKLARPENVPQDATHFVFLDFLAKEPIPKLAARLIALKKRGVKIIMVVYDPPRFGAVGHLISLGALDKVVLFDQKWRYRFDNIPIYISDYPVNQDLIPPIPHTYRPGVCYFGHLEATGRVLPNGIVHISAPNTHIYGELQKFSGGYVFDHGYPDGPGQPWSHYNKAKPIEILMSGRNAYCMAGINTKVYNKYILPAERHVEQLPVTFDVREIWELNKECLHQLQLEIVNTETL